jgi:PAS domain S-box-containing protein
MTIGPRKRPVFLFYHNFRPDTRFLLLCRALDSTREDTAITAEKTRFPWGTGAPYLFGLHQCSRARIWTLAERRLFEEIGRRFGDALTSLSVFRSLWESERKLEAAQRIAKLGWWERNYVTQRVSLSEEVQRIFGIGPVDLPAWQDRWLDLIHPDDRPKAAAASAAALAGTARYDVEYRVIRPDGAVRIVHSQGDVTRDESGRPLRQFGVLQDITERRRAETELSEIKEHFRVLAESSLTGTYVAAEDAFVYANPTMARRPKAPIFPDGVV